MSRRKHEDEHENHERWLVSYADFITLLFAFFVVMYSISSVNEGKYRVLSNSLVQAFRSVSENTDGAAILPSPIQGGVVPPVITHEERMPQNSEARERARAQVRSIADEIRRVLEPLVRDGQVRVNEGAHGISIEINAAVLFEPGEALLGFDAARALQAVAEVVAGGGFPIIVEGHTDNLPIASPRFPSNWELAAVRASSVVRLFIDNGVDPRRLTAAGYGDQRPLADNATPEGRARNRRVTILIESILPPVRSDDAPTGATPSANVDGALGTPAGVRLVGESAQP